jgi:hypothetical protein
VSEVDRVEQVSPAPPVERCTEPLSIATERARVLQRRHDFLRDRIRASRLPRHRDRAEMYALAWVLDLAQTEVDRLRAEVDEELRRRGVECR